MSNKASSQQRYLPRGRGPSSPLRLRLLKLSAGMGLSALAAGGCARSNVTTTIKPDGTWTRTVQFHGPAADNGMSAGPKLEDVFVLPAGTPWKTKRIKTKDEVVYTAERQLRAGDSVQEDIAIKDSTGKPGAPRKPVAVNRVTVQQVAPGRYQYREVIHWQGDHPKDLTTPPPEFVRSLKAALPPALATDANINDIGKLSLQEFWRTLFGPGDPMISQMLTNPDLAGHRITQRVGAALDKALQVKFADRLTHAQRVAVARKAIETLSSQLDARRGASVSMGSPDTAPAGTGAKKEDNSNLLALTFSVKLPGKIIETNGERDDLSGEVFWGLYPEAAALGDVVMTATCAVTK